MTKLSVKEKRKLTTVNPRVKKEAANCGRCAQKSVVFMKVKGQEKC